MRTAVGSKVMVSEDDDDDDDDDDDGDDCDRNWPRIPKT